MADYHISITVTATTQEAAIEKFESLMSAMRTSGFRLNGGGGGGGDGTYYSSFAGPRPLSDRERIERLEAAAADKGLTGDQQQ